MSVVQTCEFTSYEVGSIDYLARTSLPRSKNATFVPLFHWLFPKRFNITASSSLPSWRKISQNPKEKKNRILSIKVSENGALDMVSFVPNPKNPQNPDFEQAPFISYVDNRNDKTKRKIDRMLKIWESASKMAIPEDKQEFIHHILLQQDRCRLLTAKLRHFSMLSMKLLTFTDEKLLSPTPKLSVTVTSKCKYHSACFKQTVIKSSKYLESFEYVDDSHAVTYDLGHLFGLDSLYYGSYLLYGDVFVKLYKEVQRINGVGYLIVCSKVNSCTLRITRYCQYCAFHMRTMCEDSKEETHANVFYQLFNQETLLLTVFVTTKPLLAIQSDKKNTIKFCDTQWLKDSIEASNSHLSLYLHGPNAFHKTLRGVFFPGDELSPVEIKTYFREYVAERLSSFDRHYRKPYFSGLNYFCKTMVRIFVVLKKNCQ